MICSHTYFDTNNKCAACLEAEIERLRAALKNLMNDVLEYERVNNLSPNPGKQDCWQSVTEARRALEER